MPASLIQYRLRVRTVSTLANPDGVSDAFTVSSVPGDALPFISAPPTGDGQEVDPITGAVRTGAYTLEIVDATTGTDGTGTIRALTSRLEDADFRQQLLSRRAFLEIRTDGGAWSTLVAGYVLGVRLVGPVRYAVTIGDTRRVEQTQAIFQGAALGSFQTRGCLTGGPLTADWGPVKARGGWRYRVERLSGDDVELVFVEGYPVGADAPLLRDWRKVARPAIADAVGTYRQPNPYAIGGTSQFVTAYTTPVYDTATSDWVIGGGVVPIIGTTATNGAPVRALVVGLSTPQATEMLGVAPLYLYWPSCPYSSGDIVFVSLTTADVTENTPLYLDAHPVDIVTAIWTNARIRYDSGGAWIAAVRSLIGDNVRVALRLTSAPVIATFLEQAIYGPFGIAARTTAAGLQELFPTRIRTDVVPTVTLGAASLRDTDALVFDLDEGTAVSAIELTQQCGQGVSFGGVDRATRIGPLFGPLIHAEVGSVLADQVDFFHATGDEVLHLPHHTLLRATAMATADFRDDAEGAGVVAAFSDLHIGHVFGSEAEARCIVVRYPLGLPGDEIFLFSAFFREEALDDGCHLGDLIQADKCIDLGHEMGQLGGEALGHAACHDNLLLPPRHQFTTCIHRLMDGSDGLFFGHVDEGAGIDDEHVSVISLRSHGHACLLQMADHDF